MYQKDPNDSNTKEGCGRVAIYKMTQIAHCYTIEGCYACSQPQHPISRLINQINGITVPTSYFNLVSIPEVDNCYKNIYEDIGKSLAISILDL